MIIEILAMIATHFNACIIKSINQYTKQKLHKICSLLSNFPLYSEVMSSELVRYSNGPKLFACWMDCCWIHRLFDNVGIDVTDEPYLGSQTFICELCFLGF